MKKIQSLKTYTVEELGESSNKQDKTLWIVCHGYGQLVSFFKKKFEVLDSDKHHVVFPEAGNHYYLSGFNGRVGANWMTSHNRLDDITDINQYLNAVYDAFDAKSYKHLVLLGFSQGAYSIFRWIIDEKIACSGLVVWGAHLAEDYLKRFVERQKNTKLYFVLGTKDEFLPNEDVESILKLYKNQGLDFQTITYQGGHDIFQKPLLDVASKILEE